MKALNFGSSILLNMHADTTSARTMLMISYNEDKRTKFCWHDPGRRADPHLVFVFRFLELEFPQIPPSLLSAIQAYVLL